MQEHVVIRVVARLLIPFIILYGLYVLFHGKYSPGGGFQAGVIMASTAIIYSLIYGSDMALKLFPKKFLLFLSGLGVWIYTFIALATTLFGGKILEFGVLYPQYTPKAQYYSIMAIEFGIGFTVCGVMCLLFFTFARRPRQEIKDD